MLRSTAVPPGAAELVLAVTPSSRPTIPKLEVEVSALGEQLAGRVFRYGEAQRILRVPLPAGAEDEAGRTPFEFRLSDPARPVDLGLSRRCSPARPTSAMAQGPEAQSRAKLGDPIREMSGTFGDGWLGRRIRPLSFRGEGILIAESAALVADFTARAGRRARWSRSRPPCVEARCADSEFGAVVRPESGRRRPLRCR